MLKKIAMVFILGICLLPVYCFAKQDDSIIAIRSHFTTKLTRKINDKEPIEPAPPELFSIIKYPTPIGEMSAYLSNSDGSRKKQPAIIWLSGGFPVGGADGSAWTEVPPSNDQSAKIYRQMGMVIMYPFLRGSAGNPGFREGFLGEADDVISALKYLQKLDYVDPNRIYLGGHSTGGTLALIVAALTNQFKAVFAFGPVEDPLGYGRNNALHDTSIELENRLRAPVNYLSSIQSPTFIFEGSAGNIESLQELQKANKNKLVSFIPINGANHFQTLAPTNRFIAANIMSAKNGNISLQVAQVQSAYDDFQISQIEASDLQQLANMRRSGIEINSPKLISYFFLSRSNEALAAGAKELSTLGFNTHAIQSRQDEEQKTFFLLIADKKVNLMDLKSVFSISAKASKLSDKFQIHYDGWGIN